MAMFSAVGKHTIKLDNVDVPTENKRRLRLVGVKARVSTDIQLTSSNKKIANATLLRSPFDGPKGIWTAEIVTGIVGSATITAKFKSAAVASVKISVFEPVTLVLRPLSENAGMLARLLLVECQSPAKPGYNASTVKKSMQWMRLVIHNRRTHKNPGIFSAKIGSNKKWDDRDIVTASGQFHGFGSYPKLSASIDQNIKDFLAIANNYNDGRRDQYAIFVQNAIGVAKSTTLVSDPAPNGLYGWRTLGSSAPGGSFKKFQDLAGQTFYTLKK